MSHHPRKRFGQNFLHDTNTIDRIVAHFSPGPDDHVLEIGPGQAALSSRLSNRVERLQLVEIDRDLAAQLSQRFHDQGHVTVRVGDILKTPVTEIAGGHKLRVIGNIPYNITTPIIFHLLDELSCISDIQLLMQKEVAERLRSQAGQKTYGRLSVAVQMQCRVETLMDISPLCFYPKPKVSSTLVRLTPLPATRIFPHNPKTLKNVLRAAFNQRRKTLRNSLKILINEEDLRNHGFDPQLRPECLSVGDFARLSLITRIS